jgi:hypothetical protein
VRQDHTQNLDYGHLGLQHRNILLKVLSQANPHHLISIGNVVLFNKNVESRKYSMTSRPTRLKESGTMNPPKPSYDCAFVA